MLRAVGVVGALSSARLLAVACALPVVGALGQACSRPEAVDLGGPEEEPIELAVVMGELQRHSAKLGFAIDGGNQPLASFYLTEVAEVLDEVKAVVEDDGMPIGQPAAIIMDPLLGELGDALEGGDWAATESLYLALIDGCNRCHAATEHEFIEILPAQGQPPYNQRFGAAPPASWPPTGAVGDPEPPGKDLHGLVVRTERSS